MSGDTLATNAVSRFSSSSRIVEARNEQRHDLEPEPVRVQPPDRVENRLQASTELAIVAVVEALEIDFVQIDPRPQIFDHFRRAVAVRDKCR